VRSTRKACSDHPDERFRAEYESLDERLSAKPGD